MKNPDHQPATFDSGSKSLMMILILVLVVIVAIIGYVALKPKSKVATPPAAIAPAAVSITKDGFVPATVEIKKGQAVVWTNTDTGPHVVASSGSPNNFSTSPPVSMNNTYSFVFNSPGSYSYHDGFNPSGPIGTVMVK